MKPIKPIIEKIKMSKALQDFKDFFTYIAGVIGITITYDNIYKYLFGLLSLIFLMYQILTKRKENKNADLERKKLELEIEKLKKNG